MIADVVFDIPLELTFSYRVPPELAVTVGQRVRAPLHGRLRAGVVMACREGSGEGLKALEGAVEPWPLLGPLQLDLCRWIAAQGYTSLGATCRALLPPLPPRSGIADLPEPSRATPAEPLPARLLTGAGRDERLLALLAEQVSGRGVLLIAPSVETAGAWAERLRASLGQPAARLDSGAPDRERWLGWMHLARGEVRIAVGTRSALMAPVQAPATVVLLDEHDQAHKPPGHPRIHSREIVLERARREGHAAILTSATPSVESWWQAEGGGLVRCEDSEGPWPDVTVVDARGRLRSSPLSPELRLGIEETLAGGGQVCLLVTRISSVLACAECGFLLRCQECAIPLAYFKARQECVCRLCGRRERAPDVCAHCLGRQLAPLGWGAERVAQAIRQSFPRLAVARHDREAATPARARQLVRQWQERSVRLVIGTRQILSALPPAGLRLVGVITPDHLLRLPDFRAGERTFALLWAAAEWAGGEGRLIVQTQHPDHYAIRAVAAQELARFYKPELKFRAEVGYPPFRRLCLITVRDRDAAGAQRLAEECRRELERIGGLAVFPPAPHGRSGHGLRWRIVVKGGNDLPDRLRPALTPLLDRRRSVPGVVEVEMDPLELV